MDKIALALLKRGDISGLLALHRSLTGGTVMTAPLGGADPTSIVLPPAPPPPAPPAPHVQTFTADDIERARQQEKDKLYERLEEERAARERLEQQMQAFNTDLTTRQQAEQEARAAADKAAEEKRLAELSFGEKLVETEQRFAERVQTLEQQLQQRDIILAKEREFTELMQFRAELLQEHGENILPELRDLVAGNTREELTAAVSAMVERTSSILGNVVAQTQAARQSARGVGVTAPPVGPMDNNSGYETVSAADIAAMDMSTYAQNRGRLLGAASQQQRDRGMFG